MKKTFLLIAILLVTGSLATVNAQIISESAKRKITVGVDVFTDIWMNTPEDMKLRTINQGSNVFLQYNFVLDKNNRISFGAGVGLDNHNLYSNTRIDNLKADTLSFVPIADDVEYKRSKINLVTVTAPLELKFRWKSGIKVSAGIKLGYTIDSKEKYVARPDGKGVPKVNEKKKGIYQLENITFGPTLRIGYKFINIYGYYQVTKPFRLGHGPQLYPVSVGITITPF